MQKDKQILRDRESLDTLRDSTLRLRAALDVMERRLEEAAKRDAEKTTT